MNGWPAIESPFHCKHGPGGIVATYARPEDLVQVALDGTETPYPMRKVRPLTDRQREVMRWIRSRESVRPVELGRMLGAGRWASNVGCDVLRRLQSRGLVERVSRGHWRAVHHEEVW